jgi:hypothetical protein
VKITGPVSLADTHGYIARLEEILRRSGRLSLSILIQQQWAPAAYRDSNRDKSAEVLDWGGIFRIVRGQLQRVIELGLEAQTLEVRPAIWENDDPWPDDYQSGGALFHPSVDTDTSNLEVLTVVDYRSPNSLGNPMSPWHRFAVPSLREIRISAIGDINFVDVSDLVHRSPKLRLLSLSADSLIGHAVIEYGGMLFPTGAFTSMSSTSLTHFHLSSGWMDRAISIFHDLPSLRHLAIDPARSLLYLLEERKHLESPCVPSLVSLIHFGAHRLTLQDWKDLLTLFPNLVGLWVDSFWMLEPILDVLTKPGPRMLLPSLRILRISECLNLDEGLDQLFKNITLCHQKRPKLRIEVGRNIEADKTTPLSLGVFEHDERDEQCKCDVQNLKQFSHLVDIICQCFP